MQLLIQSPASDYPTWRAAFDDQAEALADAGLNTLQIWTSEEDTALVLFEVVNRDHAESWLKQQKALGRQITATFLNTV